MECFGLAPNSETMNIYFLSQCPPNPLAKSLLLRRLELPPVTDTQININLIVTTCS